LLLAAVLGSFVATAAPSPTTPKPRTFTFDVQVSPAQTAPRLLVWDKGDLLLRSTEGANLLPNRIYGVHNQEDGSWAFVLTTPAGKLPTPIELFVPGSVVVGLQIGAPVPNDRFQLSETYRWAKTDKYEMHYFWNPVAPRVVKRVRFFTPPSFAAKKK